MTIQQEDIARAVLLDLSRGLASSPSTFTNWSDFYMKNKTEKDIEQAINDLKNGKPAYENKQEKATKAARKVREAIDKNGSDAVVVAKDGSVSVEKTKKVHKMATKMKERLVKTAGRRGRPSLIGESEFKKLWEDAGTMNDLVDTLSSRPSFSGRERTEIKLHCSMRAANLRKKGVSLKKFPRGRKAK